jgi:hypothetical protein
MTVVSTAHSDWVQQVRRAAGEQPLQVIMDPVGGAMVSQLAGLLGGGGALLFYGGLAPEPITFPSIGIHHEIMFKGVSSSRWPENTSAEQRREDVAEAIEIGRVIPGRHHLSGFCLRGIPVGRDVTLRPLKDHQGFARRTEFRTMRIGAGEVAFDDPQFTLSTVGRWLP